MKCSLFRRVVWLFMIAGLSCGDSCVQATIDQARDGLRRECFVKVENESMMKAAMEQWERPEHERGLIYIRSREVYRVTGHDWRDHPLRAGDVVLEVDQCLAREMVILQQDALYSEPLIGVGLISKAAFVALSPGPELKGHIKTIVVMPNGKRVVIDL